MTMTGYTIDSRIYIDIIYSYYILLWYIIYKQYKRINNYNII